MGKRKKIKVKSSGGNIKVSHKWTILVTIGAFISTVIMTLLTDGAEKLNNIVAISVLFLIIILGIVFDILGIAVSTASEEPFHAMAAKKIPGAKTSIKIIRSAQQISSLFNDVIGDIAGIISGAMTTAIVIKIAASISASETVETLLNLFVAGLAAALMIGGKAAGKGFAMTNNNMIVFVFGKVIYFFECIFSRKKRQK